MDATMLAVFGTGLTAIGTTIALFTALWRVLGTRFDALERHVDHRFAAVDKRFEGVDKQLAAADKRWAERFEVAERASRERFEMAEKASRELLAAMDARWTERFAAMDAKWTERFEGMDRRFETIERQSQATHAAVCALNGRFDDLYRHLLAAPAQGGQSGPAPAAG